MSCFCMFIYRLTEIEQIQAEIQTDPTAEDVDESVDAEFNTARGSVAHTASGAGPIADRYRSIATAF